MWLKNRFNFYGFSFGLICLLAFEFACAAEPVKDVRNISNRRFFPELKASLDSAKKSVHVCMYIFSFLHEKKSCVSEIMESLLKAAGRGVKVSVLLERGYADFSEDLGRKNMEAFSTLRKAGISVFFDDTQIMTHSKFVVVDGKKSFVGSFNFSEAAFMKNRESGVVIDSPEVAESFITDFREIPEFSPGPVEGAVPIPAEFMTQKDLCRKMIKSSDNYVMDLYLLCQKISWEKKSARIELDEKLIFDYFLKGTGLKTKNSGICGFLVDRVLRRKGKDYPFIKSWEKPKNKKVVVLELAKVNEGGQDSLWLSNTFFEDGWNLRLSVRAKFCFFIMLSKTESGRMGRYYSDALSSMSEEFGMFRDTFSYGFTELQRFNLVDKDVRFEVGEYNDNAYFLNDFYRQEEFLKRKALLEKSVSPEMVKVITEILDLLNEPFDAECLKEMTELGKRYGLAVMEDSLAVVKREHKNTASYYRRYAYVAAMIRNKGEESGR